MSESYRTPPRPDIVNYDERRVPAYSLPDALRSSDGSVVRSRDHWLERRRPELLELFRNEVYGDCPAPHGVSVSEVVRDPRALGGLATRLELDVSVSFEASARRSNFGLLAWIPNQPRPCAAFLGLNLAGNQTVHPDPSLRLSPGWAPFLPELGLSEHVASDASRGMHAKRWPVELLVSRGYALVTAYAGEIEADYPAGAAQGALRVGAVPPDRGRGSIASWAFGLSRALDAIERIDGIDAQRVAVIGHSRLGKSALWAAALDARFALVIANSSGRGGAALSRHRFGETLRDLNARFPHWFCANFKQYDEREAELPVDQHALLGLIAPRPLYLGNAEQDLWCDPNGELLACIAAEPVFALFGHAGVGVRPEDLAIGKSYGDRIGYHRRPGGHDLLASDYWHYLAFADRHLGAGP